jgi:thiamine pyrophosphokinase
VTAIVVTGGRGPQRSIVEPYLEEASFICACDSGFDLALALDLDLDLVVGDMDSISDQSLLDSIPPERILRFDQDKDETDTEIGIRVARERGASDIIVVGGGGGRLDHLLGILSIFHRDPVVRMWLTDNDEVVQITNRYERRGLAGAVVSFFPLAGERCTMDSSGLKWPLDHLEWTVGDVGVSNVVTADPLYVEMITGRLIMVHSYGG